MLKFNKNENSSKLVICKNKIRKCGSSIKNFYNKKIVGNKNKFSMKEALLFMVITFAFGLVIGGVIMYGRGSFKGHISASLDEFITTYSDILDNYYKEIDAEELLDSGISGMIDYLGDPYAAYMTEEQTKSFNETVEGQYCGIGAEIIYNDSDKTITLGEIFDDGPAYASGLKTNDILVKVNDKVITADMALADIADMVKGKKGTTVVIGVKRGEENLVFTIKRNNVAIRSVSSEIYKENNKTIGYLGVSVFAENTDEQFEKALRELESKKIDSLIIDVRGNSGGYLSSVTNMMSLFMEKGSPLYQLSTKGDIEIVKDTTKEKRKYPIAVLVNGGSASASELLTACLKEGYGATIIGTTTFGKGKVQKAYTLSNGTMIKYTFQEWLTPNGNSIDSVGIEPNVHIEYKYNKDDKIDNQLMETISIISKK